MKFNAELNKLYLLSIHIYLLIYIYIYIYNLFTYKFNTELTCKFIR